MSSSSGSGEKSLSTESVISASSFPETTKVLTAAAIGGKTDGLPAYKRRQVVLEVKSPRYAPLTAVPVTPAEVLSAACDE